MSPKYATGLFYQRLFALDPEVKPMFRGDLQRKARSSCRRSASSSTASPNSRRHVGYGVQAAHYDTVGAALLWTLEQGPAFTDEVKTAWATAYGALAGVMKEAAYAPA
jgi:hemoglobin-like flavoprotein